MSHPIESSDDSDRTTLAPNIRLKISYDQTRSTFSNIWPDDIATSVGKMSGDEELMVDYEVTYEVVQYDEDGFVQRTYEYIEGSPSMNMPEEAYSSLRETLPHNSDDDDPVIRFELEGNEIRYVRKSGEVAYRSNVDAQAFKMDPAELDSIVAQAADTSADARRARTLGRLQASGIDYNVLDDHRISFTKRQEQDNALSQIDHVIDARYGVPLQMTYRHRNGSIAGVDRRSYKVVSGVPVVQHQVYEDYGNVHGEWAVVTRTVTHREGIDVRVQ